MTASKRSGEPVEEIVDLVFAISAEKGVDPSELPTPLHEIIDTDALERFLESADRNAHLAFEYEDLWVELSGAGDLSITELADEE